MPFCLIKKEIYEHRWVLLALIPVLFFGYLLSLVSVVFKEAGSVLESVRNYTTTYVIIGQLIVCNRLVVQEYQSKTQLFLEGLPISRVGMLTTKYVLGLSFFLIIAAGALGAGTLFAIRSEEITMRFFSILCARLFLFTTFTYSFFFLMGLLGRYRIAIYLLLLLVGIVLQQEFDFDIIDRGPLELVDSQFSFERMFFPKASLVFTAVATLGVFLLSIAMAVTREGSVASMLAEKMSQREKVFISVGLFSIMSVLVVLDQKKTPEPYKIASSATRETDGVIVHVEKFEDDDALAEELAGQISAELNELKQYLAMQRTPPLFVLNRPDLDADRFEHGQLSNAAGVLIRVNFRSDNWSYKEFRRWLVDIYLSESTNYRASKESRCWVLEGFSDYWSIRDQVGDKWEEDSVMTLRAAYAARLGLSRTDLRDWYAFRERVGKKVSSATGCAALMYAHREYGPDVVQEFTREILRTDLPKDVRSMWHDVSRTIPIVWNDIADSRYEEFEKDWINSITKASRSYKDVLDRVPVLDSSFKTSKRSAGSIELSYRLNASVEPNHLITTRYQRIGPFNVQEGNQDTKEDTWIYEKDFEKTAPERFAIGTRLRWTHSVRSDVLDCEVISGWRREVMQ